MIVLSTQQAAVVSKILAWAQNKKRPQIFTVGGFAGTGKSTVISYVIDALGLSLEHVRFVTYTGKASLVLQRKGNPAQTIHSFCYEPKLASYICPRTRIPKMRVTGFRLRTAIDPDVQLLVIDECSMVSAQLLQDLKRFGLPILALGDPAQLPPVMGTGNKLLDKPDAFLDQIHRQAADSPIIWLSMLARQGRSLPLGTHDGRAHVVPRHKVDTGLLWHVNQVITCLHANRVLYNEQVRGALGYDPGLPHPGEKLICLKNRWETLSSRSQTPLVNGLTVRVTEPANRIRRTQREFELSIEIEDEPGDRYYALDANLDFFEPIAGIAPDTEGQTDHFDYGYAITCHRSQGSEWRRVLFVDDSFGSEIQRRQLRYTGISRASEEVWVAV